jgi:pimeloyl-ACP methyl ester carboxylesterase
MTAAAADGVRLHARVAGDPDAEVTVVFAHGWMLSSEAWSAEAAALSDRVRVVSYDQRGHGASGWAGGVRSTIAGLGEDLRCVLEQLVPRGRVVLVGHSMGGMTIMALAAAHPDLVGARVAGVVLVSTSGGGMSQVTLGLGRVAAVVLRGVVRVVMAVARRWPRLADGLRRLSASRGRLGRIQFRWLLFGPGAPPATVAACADLIDATPARTMGEYHRALMEHEVRDALGPLRGVPVVIMVGELDRLTPVEHSRVLARALPEAELVVVPGCGHLLPMEQPQLVTERVLGLVVRARQPGP